MMKTAVPSENHLLSPSRGNFLAWLIQDSNPSSGERQLVVSGNALDPLGHQMYYTMDAFTCISQ